MKASQGGLGSGRVGVQRQDKAPGLFLKQSQLGFGQACTHLGHHVAETVLPGGDHVQITLHQHDFAGLADVASGHVQPEDEPALVEERRLRTVEILRLIVGIQRARPKPDHPAVEVADGDHKPVPEAIVARVALLVLGQQTGGQQFALAVALGRKVCPGRIPGIQRIADAEFGQGIVVQGPAGNVLAGGFGLWRVNQQLMVIIGSDIEQTRQSLAGRFASDILWALRLQGHARPPGKLLQRLFEIPAVLLHDK